MIKRLLGRCGNLFNEYYRNKNVFVTGHTGFKGTWLSIWLNKLGANVTGYSLEPPTKPSMFEMCQLGEKVNSIIGDIRDIEKLSKAIFDSKPEIIFHLAAQPLVRLSYEYPTDTFETNIMGTINLLESARNCSSVKVVVNVTTDKCYENTESFWGYKETDKLGGYDPYSSSKACSEIITHSYINSFFNPNKFYEHNTSIATARAGNVIGGGDFATDRLVPDCIKSLIMNQNLSIRYPHAIRPWQHVLDALNGYLKLARALENKGCNYNGSWNFGPADENEKSVEYIINKIYDLWGSTPNYSIYDNNQLHETSFLKLDSYKARKLLGFKPKLSIDESLEMVVEWTKNYLEKDSDIYNYTISQIEKYELIP